jgi:hypothetical protein
LGASESGAIEVMVGVYLGNNITGFAARRAKVTVWLIGSIMTAGHWLDRRRWQPVELSRRLYRQQCRSQQRAALYPDQGKSFAVDRRALGPALLARATADGHNRELKCRPKGGFGPINGDPRSDFVGPQGALERHQGT